MMKKIPMLLAVAATLAACSNTGDEGPRVQASGQQGQRSFQLADFDSVSLRGPDDVEVRVGPAFAITAQGDTGVMQALEIKREGNELLIGRRGRGNNFSWGDSDNDGGAIRIIVTMPAIRAASLAGSGDLRVDRVAGGDFNASLAGSGDLALAQVQANALSMNVAGSGDLSAAGTAGRVDVSIAGSGNVDGGSLGTRAAKIAIAGSGNARLQVDGDADVSIVGSGDVDLGPKARCQASKMGSGEVRCGG